MTGFLANYGKIALALAAIFLSGQVMGWMLALHSCEARPPAEVDSDRWSERMMSRLQDDLKLSPEQVPVVQGQLDSVSSRMKGKRDAALFQIHLELIKLHDDLAVGLDPVQQKKLAESRRDLVESTRKKFPELLRGTTAPPDVRQPADSTPP